MERSASLATSERQAPMAELDAAIAVGYTGLHSDGTALMSAGVAYRELTFLTATLRLPKGTYYVVRMRDDGSLIVYLVSDRKWKQWPRWKLIASLIPCKRIVEDAPPNTRVPQRRLYF